ncbi:MAG TPA: hypothetical protein VFZ65_03205 [Planctomycetota bacterium]|nr:hypothetical protein [Planctomycetota bacterium]
MHAASGARESSMNALHRARGGGRCGPAVERNCPYRDLPDHAVWRHAVGRRAIETILAIDPSIRPIAPGARVAFPRGGRARKNSGATTIVCFVV